MMTNKLQRCENCIHWQEDDISLQGECIEDEDNITVMGKHEDCDHFLAKEITLDWSFS